MMFGFEYQRKTPKEANLKDINTIFTHRYKKSTLQCLLSVGWYSSIQKCCKHDAIGAVHC